MNLIIILKKITVLATLIAGTIYCNAQQISDYLVNYQYNNSGIFRQNFRETDDMSYEYYSSANSSHFQTDGKSLYYILNSVGDAKYESYEDIKWLKEPTFKDTLNSQLVFVSYDIAKKVIVAKPFGSNYMNLVLGVKMDEQKKSICAIAATYGDSVRLNPDNLSEVIIYPNRMLRQWLLVFDLNGKLLSKCLLIERSFSIFPYNYPYINLLKANIGKFDFNKDIILSFFVNTGSKILPVQYKDSIVSDNKFYILGFNQQSQKVNWLRKIKFSSLFYFKNDIPSVKFMIGFNIFNNPKRPDSLMILSDRYDKPIAQYSYKSENLAAGNVLSIFFQFDEQGIMTPVFRFVSKEHFGSNDPRLTSIIQNNQDILAVISSTDTLTIYSKSFIGAINKIQTPSVSSLPVRYVLLKLSFNNQLVVQLHQSKDSIAPLKVMKTKGGFYVLYPYDTKSTSYNLVPTDTVINHRERDDLYNFSPFFNYFNKVSFYDSAYKLKWLYNASHINTIFDFGFKTVIDYGPYPYHDLDFRHGTLFKFNTYPDCLMAGIYNCKPIAYFDTLQKGNSIKFLNISEYNSSYKWDFGDGTTTSQKSPTHVFKANTSLSKISLIVTNTCGSDTFVRYFTTPSKISKYAYYKELKVYPNPVNGNVIEIENLNKIELSSLKLYNTFGQEVESFNIGKINSNVIKIQLLNTASSGIYYLKAVSVEGFNYVSKLIIN